MTELQAGKCPLQPDWLEMIPNDMFVKKSTLREHLASTCDMQRVGVEAHYNAQILKIDEANLEAN